MTTPCHPNTLIERCKNKPHPSLSFVDCVHFRPLLLEEVSEEVPLPGKKI